MSSKIKIIIAFLVIALLLGAGYLLFFNNNSDATAVSAVGAPTSAAQATFINLTNQLDPITFDTSVLSDPRFTALIDIHTAILPETEGRSDPFSPN
jgi:hypothetical protein